MTGRREGEALITDTWERCVSTGPGSFLEDGAQPSAFPLLTELWIFLVFYHFVPGLCESNKWVKFLGEKWQLFDHLFA
jgi:hypothetical protein